ncbi:unnamed protein product [Echinostoma caproni]|uniref:Trafficking protein particle complex subunit 11 n=1 Tax=Echinostoma caproni TaxID=27848 RepID=A0A183AA44_9TREM|nr:unnamed protein product [Echinostoma caproni]
MRKHLEEIPAVVAVFYDLDWDERQWDEKSTECAQRLETVRLEGEFHDMASNYYHARAKNVKSHKDTLNKASHQLLFVRHEFKIAFFGELKKDPALALKHYQQAYAHLLEQRMIDIHMLEMKTIAGFINYKICRLAFQSKASDAISQFRRHIEFFSNLVGMPQVAFEHEAWMSKQFEILGDLFQEAIQLSLSALMTQHPGLYYQEAARHAMARRQLCQVLCTQAASVPVDGTIGPLAAIGDSPAAVSGSLGGSEPSSVPETSRISPTGTGMELQRGKKSNINTAVEFVRAQSPLRFTRRSPSTPASPVTRSPPNAGQIDASANSGISATEKVDGLEFYGQRLWRQGIQSMEPPNAAKEREGILALQKAELSVDHSAIIILLLEQTHLQYKRYKAERMKLYPCVLMGSEYYRKGNYAKALSCYASVLGDYRRDHWHEIYTYVLRHILKCAYVTVQLNTFLSAAMELIGPTCYRLLHSNSQCENSRDPRAYPLVTRTPFASHSRPPPHALNILSQRSFGTLRRLFTISPQLSTTTQRKDRTYRLDTQADPTSRQHRQCPFPVSIDHRTDLKFATRYRKINWDQEQDSIEGIPSPFSQLETMCCLPFGVWLQRTKTPRAHSTLHSPTLIRFSASEQPGKLKSCIGTIRTLKSVAQSSNPGDKFRYAFVGSRLDLDKLCPDPEGHNQGLFSTQSLESLIFDMMEKRAERGDDLEPDRFHASAREPPEAQLFITELGQMSSETRDSWTNCLHRSPASLSAPSESDPVPSESNVVDEESKLHRKNKTRQTGLVESCNVILEANRLNVCIECKVAFTQAHYTVDQPVQLAVFLKSHAPLPMDVSRVIVEFTHSITNPLESGSDRPYSRSTTKRSVQSWTRPFTLDPTASFQMILLSLDSETLGQQIKVDTIHVALACPQSEVAEDFAAPDKPLVTLVWYWALADWPTITHHHHHHAQRMTLETESHKPAIADGTRTDSFYRSSLWNVNLPVSKLEQTIQPVKWDPAQMGIDSSMHSYHFPSIPSRWELVGTQIQTEIQDHNSKLDVTLLHIPPVLTRETYTVRCEVLNNEPMDVTNVTCFAQLHERPPTTPEGVLDLDMPMRDTIGQRSPDHLVVGESSTLPEDDPHASPTSSVTTSTSGTAQLENLRSGQRITCPISIRCLLPGPRSLRVQLAYQTALPNPVVPDFLIYIPGDAPASDSSQATPGQSSIMAVDACRLEATRDRLIRSHCVKSWQIDLDVREPFGLTCHTLSLETPNVSFADKEPDEQIANLPLSSDDCASECQVLLISQTKPGEEVVNLGSYVVQWRRIHSSNGSDFADQTESPLVTTVFPLLSCSILELPVRVRVDIPAFGTLLTPMDVVYVFENQTIYPQYLNYVFLPLRSGNVVLPRLRVSLTRLGHTGSAEQHTLKLHMEEKMLRPIPVHLFVAPSGKSADPLASDAPPRTVTTRD